jgi:biopolymer transport protein ExbD
MSVNKQEVSRDELHERLEAILHERRDKTMFIVGDSSLRYVDIVQVIDSAQDAGFAKVGSITNGMRRDPSGG